MKTVWMMAALTSVLLGAVSACTRVDTPVTATAPAATSQRVPMPAPEPTLSTAHYAITSTASPAQTAHVARAVEALHVAYRTHFATQWPTAAQPPLQLVLYRDRAELKRQSPAPSWAEAYYRRPQCHAYYAADAENPHHWMLHEAVHQLAREVMGFKRARWSDEGVAAYFGASVLKDGVLRTGTLDRTAYPVWWLPSMQFSGDLHADIAAGRVIPLRQLITGTGPEIARNVNLYYVQEWSLSHFLFHHADGRHADAYRRLLASGSTLEGFEALIGPVEAVEAEWYAYLLGLQRQVRRS